MNILDFVIRFGAALLMSDGRLRAAVASPDGGHLHQQEVTYGFELICRPDDEAHMRALMLQAM